MKRKLVTAFWCLAIIVPGASTLIFLGVPEKLVLPMLFIPTVALEELLA